MATKKAVKKEEVVVKSGKFKITKLNGKSIFRKDLGDYVKVYKAKGYKVEEI